MSSPSEISDPTSTTRPLHPARIDQLGQDLARHLGASAFPTRADQLMAALIRAHAPSALLWPLSTLPYGRVYADLDQVVSDVETRVPGPALLPPD